MYTRYFQPLNYCCLIIIIILGGCGTLPDLEPFAQSTYGLYCGITASYTNFRLQILSVDPEMKDKLDEFETEHWHKRVVALEALVEYADSLAGIAESGHSGKQNAQALSESLVPLFNMMQVSRFAGGEAFAIGSELYGAIAETAAVHSLSAAVNAADPVIREITDILAEDVDNLSEPIATSKYAALALLETPEVSDLLEVHQDLVNMYQSRTREIITHTKARPVVTADSANDTEKLYKWRLEQEVLAGELDQITRMLEVSNEWYENYQIKVDRIETSIEYQLEVLMKLREGFWQLQKTHNGIARALKENRKPNVRLLIYTTLNINRLIEESKENG